MTLFFGCRTKALDLYPEEKEEMVSEGVLKNTYLALSREPSIPKVKKNLPEHLYFLFYLFLVTNKFNIKILLVNAQIGTRCELQTNVELGL